ncbi:MAG: hypothetical protein E6R09_16230 [Rhodocyclaceae bacterium]|nr:MAG: hypothetical protein E6R09_16230 [Rhodocyclaceae bacterium]
MKRHDLSGLFGDMPKDDFAKLVDDIQRHGLQHPIVTWNGEIIDGWHRYKACQAAGVTPEFTQFAGDDKKALRFVMQENALRRHLNEAQRIRISKQVLDWHTHRALAGENQHSQEVVSMDTTSATDIAKAAGVGRASVMRHTAIEQKAPNLLPVVERGDIGLQTAEAAAHFLLRFMTDMGKPFGMIASSGSCFKLTLNKNIQLHCRERHSGRQRSKSPHQDQQVA